MNLKPISREFYLGDTALLAKGLLGKILIRKSGNRYLSARIVETEAYYGDHDPACHAYRKITERNKILYEEGGKVYVYFIYGNYYCFNIVSGKKGFGNAVLIRAVEPIEGINIMKKYRGITKNIYELTNGPAKLCMSLNIDRKLNGADVTKPDSIFITKPDKKELFEIATTKRIGLNVGEHFLYRFFIKGNPYVTKHKFNRLVETKTNLIKEKKSA